MNWLTLGKKVAGTSHLAMGTECQDFCKCEVVGEDSQNLIILVADGAGSAAHSSTGSRAVCEKMFELLSGATSETDITKARITSLIEETREYLKTNIVQEGASLRDYACTLLVAVVGSEKSYFAQVGDGGIVFETNGEYQIAFWPDSGEYVNETYFVTTNDFAYHVQFKTIETPINKIAVFSDGLQNVVLDTVKKQPQTGFFKSLFGEFREGIDPATLEGPFEAFLNSDSLNQKTDDDKTLVVAVRPL